MKTLDQFDRPTITGALTSRAEDESFPATFGDQMLGSVRRGAQRRRTGIRVAAGTVAVAAASAVALAMTPATSPAGGAVSPAGRTAAQAVPGPDAAEQKILGLPVGPLAAPAPGAPGAAGATIDRQGDQWSVRFPDGRAIALPAGTVRATVDRDDSVATHITGFSTGGEPQPSGTVTESSYVLLVGHGATEGRLFRETDIGEFGAVSPDLRQVVVDDGDGSLRVVDRETGRIVRTLGPEALCGRSVGGFTFAWTTAGLVRQCWLPEVRDAISLQLVDPGTGGVLRRWQTTPDDTSWQTGADPATLLHWDRAKKQLTLVDARTGAVRALQSVSSTAQNPSPDPSRTRVVLGRTVLDGRTLRSIGTLPVDAEGWEWRADGWLLSSVTFVRYVGPNGEALPTGEQRDDHFYYVACRQDGTQCHRLATDPKHSPDGEPTVTASAG